MSPQLDIEVGTGIEGIGIVQPYLIDRKIYGTAEAVGDFKRDKVVTVGLLVDDIILFLDRGIKVVKAQRTLASLVEECAVDTYFSDCIGNDLTGLGIFGQIRNVVILYTVLEFKGDLFILAKFDDMGVGTVMIIRLNFEGDRFHF